MGQGVTKGWRAGCRAGGAQRAEIHLTDSYGWCAPLTASTDYLQRALLTRYRMQSTPSCRSPSSISCTRYWKATLEAQ